MAPIAQEDLVLVAFVSVLHCVQLAVSAMKVGEMRKKHKVKPPAIDGPDEFVRSFRAQQNGLEFGLIFQVPLWIAGLFLHQVPAALVGLVYIYSRRQYFNGYIQRAEDRVPGFKMSVKAIRAIAVLAFLGIGNVFLKTFFALDVPAMLLNKYYRTK